MDTNSQPQTNQSKTKTIALCSLVSLLLIAGSGAFFYWLGAGTTKDSTTDNPRIMSQEEEPVKTESTEADKAELTTIDTVDQNFTFKAPTGLIPLYDYRESTDSTLRSVSYFHPDELRQQEISRTGLFVYKKDFEGGFYSSSELFRLSIDNPFTGQESTFTYNPSGFLEKEPPQNYVNPNGVDFEVTAYSGIDGLHEDYLFEQDGKYAFFTFDVNSEDTSISEEQKAIIDSVRLK